MVRFARLVLAAGGSTMLVVGLALASLGLVAAGWLRSLLPPVVIDAAAVGGAAFALGLLIAASGAGQLVVAIALPRGGRWLGATAGTLAGLLASLFLALAVASLTELARGGSAWLLAGGLALMGAAGAYAAGAWSLARASVQAVR